MGVLLPLLPLSAARSRPSASGAFSIPAVFSRLRGGLDAKGSRPAAQKCHLTVPQEEADAQDGTTVAMHSTTASELGLAWRATSCA